MSCMLAPEFVRDVGCRANLLWRCDLVRAERSAAFAQAVTTRGFAAVPEATRLGLAVFEERQTGHRLVVVLRTGRVQVRLDAMTPHETRVDEARRLFACLQRVEAP